MAHRPSDFIVPSECPVCGSDVPPKARACPHCGADERTGWNEEAVRYDGLDLPADAFDEPETNCRGFGERAPSPRLAYLWWGTGLCIIFLMIYLVFSGRF